MYKIVRSIDKRENDINNMGITLRSHYIRMQRSENI